MKSFSTHEEFDKIQDEDVDLYFELLSYWSRYLDENPSGYKIDHETCKATALEPDFPIEALIVAEDLEAGSKFFWENVKVQKELGLLKDSD